MVLIGGGRFVMSEVHLYMSNQCIHASSHSYLANLWLLTESGPLRAVHVSRHKWPRGLVN